MPTIVEVPGIGQVEFPDGMSDDDIAKAIKKNTMIGKPEKGAPLSSVTDGMSRTERLLAGMGTGGREMWQGARQLLNIGDQDKLKEEIAQTRATDAPFKEGWGAVGNIGAKAAPYVLGSLIPGVNTYTGAVAMGSLQGVMEPTVTDREAQINTAFGAVGGFGGQALGNTIGRIVKPFGTRPGPQGDLVNEATRMGIDLPASARTGNQRLAFAETTLAGLPGGKRMEQAYRLPQEQIAQRVMQEAGGSGLATQANLKSAKDAAGQTYRNIASRTMVQADNDLLNGLTAAQDWANRYLSPKEARPVSNIIDDVLSKVDANGYIPGDQYQALRGVIRRATPSDDQKAQPFMMVKKALDGAFDRSVPAADSALKKATDRQYAIQKALEPSIAAAEARGGTFTPSGLLGPLGDFSGDASTLAKINVLTREPPNSGTTQRLAYLGLLGGVGGGAGYASGGPENALTGAAVGVGLPMAASRLLSSPAVQRYLATGIFEDPALIRSAARALPPISAGLLSSYAVQQ